MFASGLFDNPWLALIFIVVGLISNWLMKRRKKGEEEGTSSPPSPQTPAKPQEEFDLEGTLRRLMGEESKPPAPAPPLLPESSRSQPPVVAEWSEEGELDHSWQRQNPETVVVKAAPPPPLPAPQSRHTVAQAVEQYEAAARAMAQLTESQSRTATAGGAAGHRQHLGKADNRAALWRNPGNARQAFVASLVFGTPKGMES